MSPENQLRVRAAVNEAGDFLKGKLPDVLHLHKRNPYAHVWERIKTKMGKSYKECNDDQVDDILATVTACRENT